ncbi:hypothetical protein G7Y89_g7693 [Cudoniella acicularis]|uniref:Uncharacterized protein n=1 Tax=Cudoniella acicularis TaxID=354080 RepID=A0A8H4W1Q5_9HELO|nr:hypothetical protein G7Y89_g7693 [Cudoniella acicularis]
MPVSAKGSQFRLEDNPHVDPNNRFPFRVNQPQSLSLRLTDIKGKVWRYKCQLAGEDWSSKAWVNGVNKWYNQIVNRRLFPQDKNKPLNKRRPEWSVMEKEWLEVLIKARINKIQGELGGRGWKAIAKAQNERFAGTALTVGHPLVGSGRGANRLVKIPWIITERKPTAIAATVRKWTDTVAMIQETLAGLPEHSDSLDEGDDEGSDEGVEESEQGLEDDGPSEDESDDEMDSGEEDLLESSSDATQSPPRVSQKEGTLWRRTRRRPS